MKTVAAAIQFLVNSNLFISLCALAYISKTSILLYGNYGNIHVNLFVFFGILLIYCFHNHSKKKLQYALTVLAGAGCIMQFFFMPLRTLLIIIPVGVIGTGYTFPIIPTARGWTRLRDIYWLKILWISFAYSWLTTFLPVVYEGSFSGMRRLDVLFIFARSFLFIFAICIPFDIRDMNFDIKRGVKTLPIIMGTFNSILMAVFFLIFFIILVIIQHFYFTLELKNVVALLLSAFITISIMLFSKREGKSVSFSLLYDGSMLLQWLLIVICSQL